MFESPKERSLRRDGPGDEPRSGFARWMVFGFVIFCLFNLLTLLLARRDGTQIPPDPDGGTVVTDETLCANGSCHNIQAGSTLNLIGGVEFENLPEEYTPGEQYSVRLIITGNNFSRVFGFQLAAILQDDSPAGTLAPVTPGVVNVEFEGASLLTHSPMPLASGFVDFSWTAPEPGEGPVRFRVAANAANDNSEVSGDHINTKEVVVSPAAQQLPAFYFPQIGVGSLNHPSLGLIEFATELIFVNTGAATPLEVEFFNGLGQPFDVIQVIDGMAGNPDSRLDAQLGAGETLRVELRGSGSLEAGYARVVAADAVGGTAVFAETRDGKLKYEAGVPATRPLNDFSLAVRSQPAGGLFDTGLALVNASPQAGMPLTAGSTATIKLGLYSPSFELLASNTIELMGGHHLPRFVSQFFPEIADLAGEDGFEGSVTVDSDLPIAALTLVQTAVPTLTAFPVIPGRADQPGPN